MHDAPSIGLVPERRTAILRGCAGCADRDDDRADRDDDRADRDDDRANRDADRADRDDDRADRDAAGADLDDDRDDVRDRDDDRVRDDDHDRDDDRVRDDDDERDDHDDRDDDDDGQARFEIVDNDDRARRDDARPAADDVGTAANGEGDDGDGDGDIDDGLDPSPLDGEARRDRGDADDASLDERREAIRRLKIDIALARSAELTALEARLYKHVVDCIDFDALFGLEQTLWFAVERLGHGALDDETGLSHRLVERALVRAALDPCNTFSDVPPGITTAERRAARYDAECPFCEIDDDATEPASAARLDHERGGETCPLCDDTAREWRAQHAEALRAAAARREARQAARREHPRGRPSHAGPRSRAPKPSRGRTGASRVTSGRGATVLLRRKV